MAFTIPRYTVDDLDRLPDDGNRYELLDGTLLVTPAPRHRHQFVVAQLHFVLANALVVSGDAHVASPGAIRVPPGTQLQPDILVYPSRFAPAAEWDEIGEHWLAVEVLSRSSRVYDREFKRDAYLALGVGEVWLVDMDAKSVEVTRAASRETVTDLINWRVLSLDRVVEVDLRKVFSAL